MVWAFCYGSLFQYAVFTDTFLDPKLPVYWNLYRLGIRKIVHIKYLWGLFAFFLFLFFFLHFYGVCFE
jgi:hypothetical protein